VVLFLLSWFMRQGAPQAPGAVALILSFVGIVLGLGTSWLGGELVDRLGVHYGAGLYSRLIGT
jgi:hypothetical protein